MNTFEFKRKLEAIDLATIRAYGVDAVHKNEKDIIDDVVNENFQGKTFAGNKIEDYEPFTDWDESGQFHENLQFLNNKDIEFTSYGDGADSIFAIFPYNDTIAPSAEVLSTQTMAAIKADFIQNIKNKLK